MKTTEQALSILGLHPGASQDEIRQAYRDLAQVWHPDRFTHNPRLRAKAQARLQEINEAYQVLSSASPPHPVREQQPTSHTQAPPAKPNVPAPSPANPPPAGRPWAWIILTVFSLAVVRSCVTAQHHLASSVASAPQSENPVIIPPRTLQPFPHYEFTTPSNTPPAMRLGSPVPLPTAQNAIESSATPSSTSFPLVVSDYAAAQKRLDRERAAYWKERGYTFDPTYMTAYSMDQKVNDIERAAYWKAKGYAFNHAYMTAYSMDQKVNDIERANYWKERGYTFDSTYMTAYSMDQKVTDIERAKYWKEKGYIFDPTYMTAYSMDNEVAKRMKSENP